jgi:protein O-GlcNAc transferase
MKGPIRPAGPVGPSRLFETAISLHQQGRLIEAERLYRTLLRSDPRHFGALHHYGVVRAQQGRLDDAIRLIRRALQQNPRSAEAHNDLGVALEAAKRFAEAVHTYEHALALRPDHADLYYNLANALQALGRHEEAIARFQKSLDLNRNHAGAHNNLAKSLSALDRHSEAIASCERALALNPLFAEAHNNLASALQVLGRHEEAIACLERALALKPDYATAHSNLANSLRELNRGQEAMAHFERAITLDPAYAEAHYNLGGLLRSLGLRERALASYEKALAIKPGLAEARFALCMAQLPILYRTEPEILRHRSAYEEQLRQLRDDVDRGALTGDLAEGLGSNLPFYLAYQGLNDRELQHVYGELACRILAEKFPPARISGPPERGERVRVGIVSGFFRRHSVWKIPVRGWLKQLDRRRFQMFGYHTGSTRDAETNIAASLCERFVQGPFSIVRWREAIAADAPHVLIYPDIGMDGVSAQLATQRLAAVQCNALGHPETSGLPTLDYSLSSDLMEPPDGQEHYTEQLIRLPNLAVYYEPVEAPTIPIDRLELGLRATGTAFWCAQSLFKYLPQYDQIYPRIAREVGDCQFVFIEHQTGAETTNVFCERLDEAFAAFGLKAADHCVFLPRLDQDRFVAAIGQCDVFLDSIGWSGNNSTSESLAHGLPIVTLRGKLMRGRHTAAILERIDVTDTITDTIDEYISTAVRLGRDISWRTAIKGRIAQNKHRIYRDRACISALEEFLDWAARREFNVTG